jgi:hypothetical protein
MIINNVGSYINTTGCAIGGFGGIIESPTTQIAPFVGPLDALVVQGANVARAMSMRRMLSSYNGACGRLRSNGSGSVEGDIPFNASGIIDNAAADSLIASDGGTLGYWKQWYTQQSGGGSPEQVTAAIQPVYTNGGSALPPAMLADDGEEEGQPPYMSIPFLTLTAPYYVHCVMYYTPTAAIINHIFAQSNTSTQNYLGTTGASKLRINMGTSLTSTANVNPGRRALGWFVNGGSSKGYIDGVEVMSGNAGSNNPTLPWQIGQGGSVTNNCFDTGSYIAEFVIFNGNPTALTGWSSFINGTKTFYGIT